MNALVFNQVEDELQLRSDHPIPQPSGPSEALVKVLRAGVCSTDLEIIRGYVHGFNHVLGHEFVGVVKDCPSNPEWNGKRVVGEINCNICGFTCEDAVFQRNHAPGRTVLGIINKDGAMAEYLTLPVENLHEVPAGLTDEQACFAEPVAAACRIDEQSLVAGGAEVAVVGDGKLGLLIAQVLVVKGAKVTLFGRHPEKMKMVQGASALETSDENTSAKFAAHFGTVVEATGAADGIKLALALLKPLGTVVLKSTVSLTSPNMPTWSELANDIVVNEKKLVGSRCGPFPQALQALQDPRMKALVDQMLTAVYPLQQGLAAIEKAQSKGTLKVQIEC